jgi:lactoylglutathione lyase
MATRKKTAPKRPAKKRQPAAAAQRAAKASTAAKRAAKPARPAPAKAAAKKPRAQPESLRLRSMSASLTVDDLERSLRFYRNGLGFVVGEEWKKDGKLLGYVMKAGTCEVGIGQDDWAKGRDRVKGVGYRLYCETTQDVDAFAARVKAAGYPLAEEPADSSWGARSFSVVDPDGFRLSIFRKIKK